MMKSEQLNRRLSREGREDMPDGNFEKIPLADNIDLESQDDSLENEKTNYAGLTPSSSQQDLLFRNPYRNQSKRLSDLIKSRTELHSIDPSTPDPPAAISEEEELSGLAYWIREASTAKEHGGDYKKRHDSALRAALGSLAVFSVLVFPNQQYLGCVWIGAIFFHTNVSDCFGAAWTSSKGYAFSILVTTLLSLPAANFLKNIGTKDAQIALPFITFMLSFIIMSCPQLTGRNLMILVMYVILASHVRDDPEWWQPLGWVASYWIGLAFAVLANLFPSPRLALNTTHTLLNRLENDLVMLLEEGKQFASHTATRPGVSRAATACIEMLQRRINNTVKELKGKIGPTGVELGLRCRRKDAMEDLKEWTNQAEKLLGHIKSLRSALVGRVLGEEIAMNSPVLVSVKARIEEQIAPSRDRLVDAMIASLAVCTAWADPLSQRQVLPDVKDELEDAIKDCRLAFMNAVAVIDGVMEENPQTNVAIFAHLTRRMSAFDALFKLGESLYTYLENHGWEAQEIKGTIDDSGSCFQYLCCIRDFLSTQWLWYKSDSLRLALKTSVGMALASLFVSITYLWNLSQPFGHWPGLTIASVNLASTASSFHKASDRLFGTLLAASYCLLVSDLFPGNKDYVKIPAIAIFTYIVLYMKSADHAYKYTYAATSAGSMLYGSIKNDFNILGYIPKRIELIFTGVMIFGLVELLLFPSSSRKQVESLSFRFFLDTRDFLKQATLCAQRMEQYLRMHAQHANSKNPFLMAGTENLEELFQLDKLADRHKKLKANVTKLKKEIEAGIKEPDLGLSLKLHPVSFRGLAKEQGDVEIQALLLLNGLRTLGKCYIEEGNPIREYNWPLMHSKILADASNRLDWACEWLKTVYPDGRLRAQKSNSVKAITAAASFRGLEDVRLRTISLWSENYSDFIKKNNGFQNADPVAITSLGTTTNYFLELCRHLQKAGKHVEEVAHHFPTN